MKNEDLPAFPTEIADGYGNPVMAHGLSKREYFAGLAMQGWIACQQPGYSGDTGSIVSRAIECADELLKQLENK